MLHTRDDATLTMAKGTVSGTAGGRRLGSQRRRAEPTRYSDDRPDTVTYEQQYGGNSVAPTTTTTVGGRENAESNSNDGSDQQRRRQQQQQQQQKGEDESNEKKSDGSISHRVAFRPALRYTRPAYLQAAVDTLKETRKAAEDTTCANGTSTASTIAGITAPAGAGKSTGASGSTSASKSSTKTIENQEIGRLMDAKAISTSYAMGSKPPSRSVSRRTSASSAVILPASDPRSELYQLRRQEILSSLKSDPSLTPLFGPSLGLLHRTAAFREKSSGGGSVGADDLAAGGSTTTIRSDWDTVRYNEFYYPGDYIDDDDASSSRASALPAPNRKRLRPGVLPVSRSVTVLAMTKNRTSSPCKPDSDQRQAQRSQQQFRYIAIGDTAGFVTLYATQPILSPVSRLETTASRREYEEELVLRQRYKGRTCGGASTSASASVPTGTLNDDCGSDGATARRGGVRFAGYRTVIDSSRSLVSQMWNAIEALAFNCTGTRIAVATKAEVELLDCLTGSMLWTCPTASFFGLNSTVAISVTDKGRPIIAEGASKMSRGAPIKLSCHPTFDDGDVIAGYSFDAWSKHDQDEQEEGQFQSKEWEKSLVSPLLQFVTKTQQGAGRKELAPNVRAQGIIPVSNDPPLNDDGNCLARSQVAMGPRSIAVHDESNPNRILAIVINLHPLLEDVQADVAWRRKDRAGSNSSPLPHLQELLLIDSTRLPYQVISRVTLPARASSSKLITVEAICQSSGGMFTAAATAFRGGIRLYKTDNLAHLATYGEGITLHGRTIFWQDLFIVKRGRGGIEEREDEMALRISGDGALSNSTNDATLDHTDLMLVAAPHAFREPKDLNDRLYIWDLADIGWGGTKLPAVTVIAPAKSNGIASVLYDNCPGTCVGDDSIAGGGGRFILSTQSGDCRQIGPKLVSEWPGRMYPVGYIVLDDNVEYVEDEDELDVVVDGDDGDRDDASMHVDLDRLVRRGKRHSNPSNVMDYDLKMALEQSMFDVDVDVLSAKDEDQKAAGNSGGTACLVSTQPEAYLRRRIDDSARSDEPVSPTVKAQANGVFDIMDLMPHLSDIEPLIEKNVARGSAKDNAGNLESETPEVSYTKSSQQRLYKGTKGGKAAGKKIKSGSLEAILSESIDPKLRAAMVKKELWSDGEGASLRKSRIQCTDNNTEDGPCEACLGRPIHHRCGRRLIPEDYEAIARAEEERKKKDAEEKKRAKLEKKRQQDAQRREAKRQKKLHEEERKAAAERAAKERAEEEIRVSQREEEERINRIRRDDLARQEAVRMQQEAMQLASLQQQEQQRRHEPQPQAVIASPAPVTFSLQSTACPPVLAASSAQVCLLENSTTTVSHVPATKSREEEEEEERRNIAQQLLGFGTPGQSLGAPVQPPSAPALPQTSLPKTPALANPYSQAGNRSLAGTNQYQRHQLSSPYSDTNSSIGQGHRHGTERSQQYGTSYGTVVYPHHSSSSDPLVHGYGIASHQQSVLLSSAPLMQQDQAMSIIAQAAGHLLNSMNGSAAQVSVEGSSHLHRQTSMTGLPNSSTAIPVRQKESSKSDNATNSNQPTG